MHVYLDRERKSEAECAASANEKKKAQAYTARQRQQQIRIFVETDSIYKCMPVLCVVACKIAKPTKEKPYIKWKKAHTVHTVEMLRKNQLPSLFEFFIQRLNEYSTVVGGSYYCLMLLLVPRSVRVSFFPSVCDLE